MAFNSIIDIRSEISSRRHTPWKEYGDIAVTRMGNYTHFSYTDEAVRKGRWNFLERASNGLIIDNHNYNAVAIPYPVILDATNQDINVYDIVHIQEKMDGAEGVMYFDYRESRWKIVGTRGVEYDNPIFRYANEWIYNNLKLNSVPNNYTFMVNIIPPDYNTITNYGDSGVWMFGCRKTNETTVSYTTMLSIAGNLDMAIAPLCFYTDSYQDLVASLDSIEHAGYIMRLNDGSFVSLPSTKYKELRGGF